MGARVRRHVRSNVVGYIALMVAVAGVPTAWALARNSIKAKHIAPKAVGTSELKNNAATGTDINEATLGQVPSAQSANSAQTATSAESANSANSAQNSNLLDDLNSTDFLRSNASAGGDLSGNYPSPTIANGAVTPGKLGTIPAVRATVPCEAGIAAGEAIIPNNTEEPVVFMSDLFDTAGMHIADDDCPAESARLTAPRAGIYHLSGGVLWQANTTGVRQITLRQNGSTGTMLASQTTPALGANLQEVSSLVMLNQGDYIELLAYQTSGGDLQVQSGISAGEQRSYVAMAWVGPG
jgi:hypothetical protein